MSRLTEYHCGVAVIKDKGKLKDAMQKLANYEDLEEQSLLVILPCKVGDEVFVLHHALSFDEVGDGTEVSFYVEPKKFTLSMYDECNKSIFLTKRDAEHAVELALEAIKVLEKDNE